MMTSSWSIRTRQDSLFDPIVLSPKISPMLHEVACPHGVSESARRLCAHLVENAHQESVARFTGSGLDYELLCRQCAAAPEGAAIPMRSICAACFSDFDYWQE
jgi:hypothetical protein